ncbi:chitin synthase-domain-containing protein [Polychytrium aggregatum]|uniref:chitin synthase-domain-containing protein n=1 Tax=Polychytrium aggregatum TaxID=110093 RepID=UPI0022FED201|nr:chitin synthase-domain-containing protein [Polychytrium aggregatum]KAI9206676.1 chitin synthase-domain-containing protein [Polychytrium aggregatum]
MGKDLRQTPPSADAQSLPVIGTPANAASTSDLVKLPQPLSDESILDLLQQRFKEDKHLSWLGPNFVVSVNPFKQTELPNSNSTFNLVAASERDEPIGDFRELACAAYFHLICSGESQVVITSGESGSGKSVAVQKIIAHLAYLSDLTLTTSVFQDIKDADEIIQAFTHASTTANRNSSRVGRYSEIQFTESGNIAGMKSVIYMLEQRRCSNIGGPAMEDDQNFHIFYQLVLGASSQEKTKWKIGDIRSYSFLNHGKGLSLDHREQSSRFQALQARLRGFRINRKMQDSLFKVLSAILLLGNLEFGQEQKDEHAYVKNRHVLDTVAEFLELESPALENAITTQSVWVGDTMCADYLDPNKASDSRDDLASILYSLVVSWIVSKLNETLSDDEPQSSIGLIDMPGHEDFSPKPNYFEQYCINYASEKIHAFIWQRSVYASELSFSQEGLQYRPIDRAVDDTARLVMYEDPYNGLFALTDSYEGRTGGKGSEGTLLELFMEFNQDNQYYAPSPVGWSSFGIKHYFGKVTYDLKDFVRRNKTTINATYVQLFGIGDQSDSRPDSFVAGLFGESIVPLKHPKNRSAVVGARRVDSIYRPSESRSKRLSKLITGPPRNSLVFISSASTTPTTAQPSTPSATTPGRRTTHKQTLLGREKDAYESVGSCLRKSFDVLLSSLSEFRPWSVLCVKPCNELIPDRFSDGKVLGQIAALKLAPLASFLCVGYSIAIPTEEFKARYAALVSGIEESDPKAVAAAICAAQGWPNDAFALGEGRVFLQEKAWKSLELKWARKNPEACPWINEVSRATLARQTENLHKIASKNGLSDEPTPPDASDMELGSTSAEPEGKVKKRRGKKKVSPVSGTEKTAKKPKREPKPRVPMSRQRRCWVNWTWCVTWWVPSVLLDRCGGMKSEEKQMAWREKCALCFIIALLSGMMLFFVQGFGKILCPSQSIFNLQEVAQHTDINSAAGAWATWNGQIYDITKFINNHPTPGSTINLGAGKDISAWFPRVSYSAPTVLDSSCCVGMAAQSDGCHTDQYPWSSPSASLMKRMDQEGAIVGNQAAFSQDRDLINLTVRQSSAPASPCGSDIGVYYKGQSPQGYCHQTWALQRSIMLYQDIPVYYVGTLGYPPTEVYTHNQDGDIWITYKGSFYNMTNILSRTSTLKLFPPDLWTEVRGYIGRDASVLSKALAPYEKCMNIMFFNGIVDDRSGNIRCQISEYLLLSVTGIMVFVVVIKFLAALQLGSKKEPENNDRFVIMQVPCYTEGEASLRKTIDSLSLLNYDDTRKLLFMICDGMVTGGGNDLPTPDLVLKILGVDPNLQKPEAQSYIAISDGSKQHNKAKVYSGLYHIQARSVPFIVVVKVGNETETLKPGNRGKRDSQILMMKFLSRVHFKTPMTPLDLEIYHHIKDIIGVDPYLYEYCLMVDADTEVLPDSLNRLISSMVHDSKIMGICGETKIANEKASWVTMMQVYEYYISHHMAKAFESLFGSVTCLPGCFCMYRIRTAEKRTPLLISPDIISEYEDNVVNTLHKQNLLSLGEDRYLTTLMLKHFPEYRNKFISDAICLTIVPDKFEVLLSQRRRWINSTIHNLFELIFLPQLCGCLCFSMRLVVFLDLFATLVMPASVAYLFYLIAASIQQQQAPLISIVMISVAYGLQVIIFILKREFAHIGWIVISILAMPAFSFYIPLYSYWHFDDFRWGNTHKVAGLTGKDDHSGDGQRFDASTIPTVTWEAFERQQRAAKPAAGGDTSPYSAASFGRMEYAPSMVESRYAGPSYRPDGSSYAGSGGQDRYAPSVPEYAPSLRAFPKRESTAFLDEYASAGAAGPLDLPPYPEWTRTTAPEASDLEGYVEYLLGTHSLRELTKRKVREKLSEHFHQDLSSQKDLINSILEAALQKRALGRGI